MSNVKCQMLLKTILYNLLKLNFFIVKGPKFVGGESIINGATPSSLK